MKWWLPSPAVHWNPWGAVACYQGPPQTHCADPEGQTWAVVVLTAPRGIVGMFRAGNLEWEQYFPSLFTWNHLGAF